MTPAITDPANIRILVFDSGVGGLSILQEIHRKIPAANLVYACDNQAFPYGTKEEDELVARVDSVLKALFDAVQPDIVVVACNTASTVALPRIRAHFSNPVVGVVPAIKPAAIISRTKVIGLLATPGTVRRDYTRQLIAEFAEGCDFIAVGSSRLVEIAEEKLRGIQPDTNELKTILAPLLENTELDTVVLACTHFPLLKAEIESLAPRLIHWIDSGEAIARRVHSLIFQDNSTPYTHTVKQAGFPCWLTDTGTGADSLIEGLQLAGADTINAIPVE
jgi:glutamate racemase